MLGGEKVENKDDHLLACLIYVTSFFTTIIAPLIIWLIKKDESDLVDFHGKEYFNLFLSYTIYGIVSGILMIVIIGFILAPIVAILLFIFTILGAIKAYQGEYYEFPLVIRFFR